MERLDSKIPIKHVHVCKLPGKDTCNDIVYIIKHTNIPFQHIFESVPSDDVWVGQPLG